MDWNKVKEGVAIRVIVAGVIGFALLIWDFVRSSKLADPDQQLMLYQQVKDYFSEDVTVSKGLVVILYIVAAIALIVIWKQRRTKLSTGISIASGKVVWEGNPQRPLSAKELEFLRALPYGTERHVNNVMHELSLSRVETDQIIEALVESDYIYCFKLPNRPTFQGSRARIREKGRDAVAGNPYTGKIEP